MTTFGLGGPTVEDLEFVVEMVRYRAEVRRRINEAASRELEEKLEWAKRAQIAAKEAEAERQVKERHEAEALERKRPLGLEREQRQWEQREQEQLERERLTAARLEKERMAEERAREQERVNQERLEWSDGTWRERWKKRRKNCG